MENDNKHCMHNECLSSVDCTNIGNGLYDILTACISIADVTTDILVISNFYHKEQFTFFWIALSVVIFAQLVYAAAFVLQYANYYDHKKMDGYFNRYEMFGWFLVGLLLSPIMSFIFYWTSDPDMCLAKIFEKKFALYIKKKTSDEDKFRYSWVKEEDKKKTEKSPITEWIETKLRKHLGFILEAGIEFSNVVLRCNEIYKIDNLILAAWLIVLFCFVFLITIKQTLTELFHKLSKNPDWSQIL